MPSIMATSLRWRTHSAQTNSKEEPRIHSLELVKKMVICTLPFQKKTIFQDIKYYDILEAECIMQAFRSDENQIILAISVKFKEELFQNLDKQLEEPGMRYLTNPCSTPNPQEALWPISNSPE